MGAVLGTMGTTDSMDTMGITSTMGIRSTMKIADMMDMGISGITNQPAMTWGKAPIHPHSSCITIFRVVMTFVMLSFHESLAMTTTEVMSPLSR